MLKQILIEAFRGLRKSARDSAGLPPTPPGVKEILDRGDAALAGGQHEDARRLYHEALAADPPNLYAHYRLAESWLATNGHIVAREWCERGLAIDPHQIGLLELLAEVASKMGDPLLSVQCYEAIAARNPEFENLEMYIANQLPKIGKAEEAIAAYDQALARAPDSVATQSNRLFVLNYVELMSPEALSAEHRRWALRHKSKFGKVVPGRDGSRDPDKRLRIGYLSADFRNHAVAYFLEPLLARHDTQRFEIVCFDAAPAPGDDVTRRFTSLGHEWHSVATQDDPTLAETVRKAGIDVLVDLSGHSAGNRLLVFARKPAPVQASWLGYLNTTGLESIDYRVTDHFLDPAGLTEHLYVERLVRLPHHAALSPPEDAPEPGPLPLSRTGHVTFASLNNWAKVTNLMKQTWSELLRAVPNSKLLITASGVMNAGFRAMIASEFGARGVSPDRIETREFMPFQAFLGLAKEVDIALDTHPYAGGTTTLHSLWMGVPVVTLAGRTAFSRNSVGSLSATGLSQLITTSREEYVRQAIELSRDLPRLVDIRARLREGMRHSALVDCEGFARNLEAAYRAMWRNHCARRHDCINVA